MKVHRRGDIASFFSAIFGFALFGKTANASEERVLFTLPLKAQHVTSKRWDVWSRAVTSFRQQTEKLVEGKDLDKMKVEIRLVERDTNAFIDIRTV